MTVPYAISPCTELDLLAAIELLSRCAREFFFPEMGEEAQIVFLRENTVAAAQTLQAKGFVYLAAKQDAQLLGFISISPEGYIHQLFVEPDRQKQGLGRALLAAGIAAISGETQIDTLSVSASNNAVRFYETLGFVRSDEPQSWHGIPYNPMIKTLPQNPASA
ncbi:GNAT family N-acetyltransferase [Chitinibacter bivalviorum]|uniref:GNAT family N-acetyltransferase n=1 Tax=Chitinibacter bivalviorum TaxID=2739434 RepID=A0A7H9BEF3_9NEIS|nr:GNAT family N-acetyltransferase [Chitinibacter bivalviorum]QLG87103.1 GNAT family N-acetyltransferase [Chitinibacter bivalviorum]